MGSRSEEKWRGCKEGYEAIKSDALLYGLLLHDEL